MKLTKIVNQKKLFVKATGTSEIRGGLDFEVGKGAVEEVGNYGINNGVIGLIDGNQDKWVGYHSQETVQALENAGYQNLGMDVPHCNDGGYGIRKLFGKIK